MRRLAAGRDALAMIHLTERLVQRVFNNGVAWSISLCLFEATDSQLVGDVNEAAQIPFSRISEALDLTPASAAH
jgi:hypothetical protein